MLPKDEVREVVASDLRYIRDEWREDVSDDALRRGSTVLRLFLVYGELQRAWKAAGMEREPFIVAASLVGIPSADIAFAASGGAKCNGVEVASPIHPKPGVRVSPAVMNRLLEKVKSGNVQEAMKLSEFAGGTCLMVEGIEIPRRMLIKYVAQKLGGAHLDRKRDGDDGPIFRLLDQARAEYVVADKPVIYFELLAIGQAIVGSPDIQRLMEPA